MPIGLQNAALTAAFFPRRKLRSNTHFHETLYRWEERVDDPVDAQCERQWDLLTHLLERAREHVPYYRFLPPVIDTGEASSSAPLTAPTIRRLPAVPSWSSTTSYQLMG